MYEIERGHKESGIIGKNSDVKGGIGTINLLIDFSSFAASDHPLSFDVQYSHLFRDNGKQVCKLCGYDRGIVQKHTEVNGYSVSCHNCDKTVFEVKP